MTVFSAPNGTSASHEEHIQVILSLISCAPFVHLQPDLTLNLARPIETKVEE